MDLSAIPQLGMDWDSVNLPEAWTASKQHVELVFEEPIEDKPGEIKVIYLLVWKREQRRYIYNIWPLYAEEKKHLEPDYDSHILCEAN